MDQPHTPSSLSLSLSGFTVPVTNEQGYPVSCWIWSPNSCKTLALSSSWAKWKKWISFVFQHFFSERWLFMCGIRLMDPPVRKQFHHQSGILCRLSFACYCWYGFFCSWYCYTPYMNHISNCFCIFVLLSYCFISLSTLISWSSGHLAIVVKQVLFCAVYVSCGFLHYIVGGLCWVITYVMWFSFDFLCCENNRYLSGSTEALKFVH